MSLLPNPWLIAGGAVGAASFAATIVLTFSLMGEKAAHSVTAKERDGVVHWAEVVCSSAGATFKQGKRAEWGRACGNAIASLAEFKTQAVSKTNDVLVTNLKTQLEKRDRDLAAARKDAATAKAAMRKLTEASANVKDDQVGPDYFGALNLAAGLRDHGAAPAAD